MKYLYKKVRPLSLFFLLMVNGSKSEDLTWKLWWLGRMRRRCWPLAHFGCLIMMYE
jgi:hypothetical protein